MDDCNSIMQCFGVTHYLITTCTVLMGSDGFFLCSGNQFVTVGLKCAGLLIMHISGPLFQIMSSMNS